MAAARSFLCLLLLAAAAAPRHCADSEVADGETGHYYWNEVTGQVQWEDPGNTPFEDDRGYRCAAAQRLLQQNTPPPPRPLPARQPAGSPERALVLPGACDPASSSSSSCLPRAGTG
jgi:hypothetical protein